MEEREILNPILFICVNPVHLRLKRPLNTYLDARQVANTRCDQRRHPQKLGIKNPSSPEPAALPSTNSARKKSTEKITPG